MYIGIPKGEAPIQSVQSASEIKPKFSSQGNVNRKQKTEKKKKKFKTVKHSIINLCLTVIFT